MEYLLGVFENPEDNFLPFLGEESKEIEAVLRSHRRSLNTVIQRNMGLTDFITEIETNSDLFSFIHFSGHHERGFLSFNDHAAYTEGGLFDKLNRLENLFCVFLNGCSTIDAVKQLSNIPVVIVTTQPVYDQIAKEISIAFYTNISRKLTKDSGTKINDVKFIEDCFERAKETVFTTRDIVYDNMQTKLSELEAQLTDELEEEQKARLSFEISTLKDERVQNFRGGGSRAKFDESYYKIVFNKKESSLGVELEVLDDFNIAYELENLKNSISEDITLASFYNSFPSIFAKNIFKLCTQKKSLLPDRFDLIHKIFSDLSAFTKCLTCSIWWDYYLCSKKDNEIPKLNSVQLVEAKNLLREIIEQEFKLFHKRPNNASEAAIPSKSIQACLDIIGHLPEAFINANDFYKLYTDELKKAKSIFEKGAHYFSTDITYEKDERLVRSLIYHAEHLFYEIIKNFTFLRAIKLKSVYDISYYNYKYDPASKVKLTYLQHDHEEMLAVGNPITTELIDVTALNNFVHSVQLIYVPNQSFNTDLSPFIIDSNAFEETRTNKINYCFLKSLIGERVSFLSFANESKEYGNDEVENHLEEFVKFINNE